VCLKLKKALYGLKQAPRCWNKNIEKFFNTLGYYASPLDECLYQKIVGEHRIYLILYVDDTIVIYPKILETIWLQDKERIRAQYKIKDLGNCEWVFNMKLDRNRTLRQMTISQEAYITKMVEEFGFNGNHREITTPYRLVDLNKPSTHEATRNIEEMPLNAQQQTEYRAKINSVAFAARNTRIDLLFITGRLARDQCAPQVKHMNEINRVLRYCALTKSRKLFFDYSNPAVHNAECSAVVYTDSDWAGDTKDRKSTTGWLLMLNGAPISWQSKKQSTVANSSSEAEYYALGDGAREALFIRQWFAYYYPIHVNNQIVPILATLRSDNCGCMLMADHATDHNRTKHIDIKHHFIREHIQSKSIKLEYIETAKQLADILTKTVKPMVFQRLTSLLYKEESNQLNKPLSIKEGVKENVV
jgi:hypothetical protein